MYAGWLLTNNSGAILGAHQTFDKEAYKLLVELISNPVRQKQFPEIKDILFFEGKNGPDGLKAKSPGKDEPHHFFDPFDPEYTDLLRQIDSHFQALCLALNEQNLERSAFEAAWLAHAITDGLTPAHHYPYEEELKNIRGSIPAHTVMEKVMFKGSGPVETVKKNWSFWGAKGLFLTHGMFELGIAAILKTISSKKFVITDYDRKTFAKIGLEEFFKRSAREIAIEDMYDRFYQRGWTPKLASDVREILAPLIVKVIALAWYSALIQAGQLESN